jgi:hypothetical protein
MAGVSKQDAEDNVWMEEEPGALQKLHNEELRIMYYSLNITMWIKSRRMNLLGHVLHKGKNAFIL